MTRPAASGSRTLRYLVTGAWNTLFGYGVFVALCRAGERVGAHYLWALTVSQALATVNAYLGYKHFVFKTSGGWVREYARFSLVYWIVFAVNFAALPALVNATGLGPIPVQGALLCVTVAASYWAHGRFSFGQPPRV